MKASVSAIFCGINSVAVALSKVARSGPWADHARAQIHKLLSRDRLSIAWRGKRFVPKGTPAKAALRLE